jgi:hypothetical protein
LSLAEALERAASFLDKEAEAIRPANGDPVQLLRVLDADAAARVLTWLLREDLNAGEELAGAWAELPEAVEALGRVDEDAIPKAARKVLRRALHRLRSRGVDVGRPPAEAMVATLPSVEDGISVGLVTPVDPSGAQLLILAEPNPGGGVRLFEAVVDDERGIVDFVVLTPNRSQARRLLRDLSERGPLPAIETSPEAVRARLARVAARHPVDRALPQAFADWRARMTRTPEGARTPGELAREALAGGAPLGGRERLLELVEQGEVGPWPPSAERLRSIAERLHKLGRSRLLVSDEQRRQQLGEAVRDALGEQLAADGRERVADRFEETAYAFWRQERVEEARACLQAAQELREGEGADHPVARALLERALRPIFTALREEERSSLVVKP